METVSDPVTVAARLIVAYDPDTEDMFICAYEAATC